MEYLGCDYAARADAAYPAFKARGFSFVVRYLTPPGYWNRLSRDEANQIAAAGFGIVSVWETNPTKASFFTAASGAQEGAMAVTAAEDVGQPAGTPIYAAVDYDMQDREWPAVEAYLKAFQQALGGAHWLGVYGGYAVIDRAQALTRWLWQTYAWSGGRLHPAAILYQYQNGVQIGGADTDLDRAFGDPGWWRPDEQPVQPVPAPQQTGGVTSVPLTKLGDSGVAIEILQALLNAAGYGPIAVDGAFGSETQQAVTAFQQAKGLRADGIVGPLTWGALAKTPAKPRDSAALNTQLQNLNDQLYTANTKLAQIKSIVG